MKTISYSNARKNLKVLCDEVCDEQTLLIIERRNGEAVVVLSKENFTSLEETAYLLRSPKNAKRLLEAKDRKKSDRKKFKNLSELKNALGV
ncbi:type II toxin-antitoxin system prevent-host-death family antitoxin [Candidatus Peregrinibacteria bacterium]|nr:type II toxin-antitoxin system prevent-host-death family antitoxin [Candidatus Peregrinibacteria bacterium]